ncbi:MAG: hypothetical protein ACOCX2_09205 [Armatimonadota bacterium]
MRWWQNLSRVTRSFTIVPREPGVIVAVGSDSGYLCAFDAEGENVWGVALTHQPDRAVVLGLCGERGANERRQELIFRKWHDVQRDGLL